MDTAVLQSELAKAKKRLVEQTNVVQANRSIIEGVGMETLKSIATRRMPKLLEIQSETIKVIAELEKALGILPQADLPFDSSPTPGADVPSAPVPPPRRR